MSSNTSAYDSILVLCEDCDIPESELIVQLHAILQANPNVIYEENYGWTPLHYAAECRPPEFCQVLISLNEDAVRAATIAGDLPFHVACFYGNTNTAKYLCRLYPESISIRDGYGSTPLERILFRHERTNEIELIKFLLDNDQGAVSTPDEDGQLPLHKAATICSNSDAVMKLVFNAYPNAIHTTDND